MTEVTQLPHTDVSVFSTISQFRQRVIPVGLRRAVVLTMGALHEGHQALMRAATANGDVDLAVSIFVNPLQFNNVTDLDTYPKSLEADLRLCAQSGVQAVFVPSVYEMYPHGAQAEPKVTAGPLGDILEGESRPKHFDGVLTVVNKLINILEPDVMYFGEKDYQQLLLIKRMVAAFDLPVEIVGVPTVRDSDGLAKSSRNVRLSAQARAHATHLYASLLLAKHAWQEGTSSTQVEHLIREYLSAQEDISVDYVAVCNENLQKPQVTESARALVAAHIGGVRLIDNLDLGKGGL